MTVRTRLLSRTRPEQRPIFVLKIEGPPGADSIRHLRALLKRLLRQHHFRAIDVRQIEGRREALGGERGL